MMKAMDSDAKKKVLEDLITAMEDRESGAKIKGAKPLLQILIAAGGEGSPEEEAKETPAIEEQEDAAGETAGELPEMSDTPGNAGMPPELAALIEKMKREKR